MKGAAQNPAVIALRKLQVLFSLSVANASKFFATDHELAWVSFRFVLAVPTRLFRIPGHTYCAERFRSTNRRPCHSICHRDVIAGFVAAGFLRPGALILFF
jgi:hypothetical protein